MKRLVTALALLASAATGQPQARRATNIAALLNYPGFYHQRPIVLVGQVSVATNGEIRVGDDSGSIRILVKGTSAPEGSDEIRGEFWDIGRMKSDDPQLATYDLAKTFQIDPDGPWPKPGQFPVIIATAVTAATPPPAPSIRSMVLFPGRYVDQTVTVTGQFTARNVQGDVADAPGRSKYDFVLRSADAAIWVANIRPKGKDFELALDSRIDTGRWVEVTGVVRQGRGLQWIDGQAGTISLTKAPVEQKAADDPIRVPAGPPPEVVFSAPTADETDVLLTSSVRIQFSRDINPATVKGNVKVTYLESETRVRGEFVTPTAVFTTQYTGSNRVLEIRFTEPLERFRTVTVELLEGITGTDGQPLKPWTLTFQTGA